MEDTAPTPPKDEPPKDEPPNDEPPPPWKCSARRSRKAGCSNIFTGVNLSQLRRLFQVAGEQDAEHRAKLVLGGVDGGMEGAVEEEEKKGEEEEAGLAQALVGLRVRARRRVGIRATEGHREPKWLRSFGHLRIKEPSAGHTEKGEEGDPNPRPEGLLTGTGEGILEHQIPCEGPLLPTVKTSIWKQEWVRDPERYLHRVLR